MAASPTMAARRHGTSWRRTRSTITITMPTTSISITAVSTAEATSFLERSR